MSYVLVKIPDEEGAPISTVVAALQDAGVEVQYWEARSLEWVMSDVRRIVADLQHLTEAVEALTAVQATPT